MTHACKSRVLTCTESPPLHIVYAPSSHISHTTGGDFHMTSFNTIVVIARARQACIVVYALARTRGAWCLVVVLGGGVAVAVWLSYNLATSQWFVCPVVDGDGGSGGNGGPTTCPGDRFARAHMQRGGEGGIGVAHSSQCIT